jgi:hypothetical protein
LGASNNNVCLWGGGGGGWWELEYFLSFFLNNVETLRCTIWIA